jgi:hypothetical protein
VAKKKPKKVNPVAKNLRLNKPKVIQNKRRKIMEKLREEDRHG